MRSAFCRYESAERSFDCLHTRRLKARVRVYVYVHVHVCVCMCVRAHTCKWVCEHTDCDGKCVFFFFGGGGGGGPGGG